MDVQPGLAAAANLFRILGNESRIWLVLLLHDEPRTITALARATGLSQPLVSQHLQRLRQADLVAGDRHGRQTIYRVADKHISHLVTDALVHVQEPAAADLTAAEGSDLPTKEPA